MSCPTDDLLDRFLKDDLTKQDENDVAAHLDQCEPCQSKIDKLLGVDTLVPSTVASFCIDSEAYDRILDRIKALGSADLPGTTPGGRRRPAFVSPPRRHGYMGRFGDFDVIDVIGRGGMGVVLKAHDPTLDRVVAIKVLSPELANGEQARKRFLREARAAAAVTHENIAPIYMVSEYSGLPYLVMPVISGGSVQDRIDRNGPLPPAEVASYMRQVAHGLAAAHARNMIHRDIKPTNLMLDDAGSRVMIVDFGLARCADDVAVTATGTIAGTPQYMAPEQAMGQRIDHRADLYSLGAVAYAMATGDSPFPYPSTIAVIRAVCDEQPKPIRDDIPDFPQHLVDAISRLMAKDPAERFASAEELVQALDDTADPNLKTITGTGTSTGIKPAAKPKPQPRILWPGAAMITMVVAGLLWITLRPSTTPPQSLTTTPPTTSPETPIAQQALPAQPTDQLPAEHAPSTASLSQPAAHDPPSTNPPVSPAPVERHTPPSSPPDAAVTLAAATPYVLTDANSGITQGFETLTEAIVAAPDHAVIDITTSDTFQLAPIKITSAQLTIRAAANKTPTLAGSHGTLLSNSGNLTLEGITFTGPVNAFVSSGNSLTITNCTFDGRALSGDNPACIQIAGHGPARAINSAFYSKGAAAFRFNPGSTADVTLANSVHAGRGTFHFVKGATLDRRLTVIHTNLAVIAFAAFENGITQTSATPLVIDVRESVLDYRVFLLDASQPRAPFTLKPFKWAGGKNLIASAPLLTGTPPTRATFMDDSAALWDWPGFAGEEIKRSPHGKIVYAAGTHPALWMARGADRIPSPTAFRVGQVKRTRRGRAGPTTGYQTMGAQFNTIGPGTPYLRFLTTPDYNAWSD